MNETLRLIHQRQSLRGYDDRAVERSTVDAIIQAAMRAPTAGNLMLYSILEIEDDGIKEKLAVSCDNQPFIARAPLVLIFLADYERWMDVFAASGVPALREERGASMRRPGEGDLMLACCDALIAAQTAVIAAESLGLGSCYIGDIMERYAYHQELLDLPRYTFPISMVCFGYPRPDGPERPLTSRFPQACIHFKDGYRRLEDEDLLEMVKSRKRGPFTEGAANVGQQVYARKFSSDYAREMTRSVREAMRAWTAEGGEDEGRGPF